MSYVPVATQTTEPLASRSVESAALEFRTLKSSVNARVDALTAETVVLDGRIDTLENAIASLGDVGGLPGMVYIQRASGTGSQTVYTLVAVPTALAKVDVYVQGIYQQHNTFSVSGSTLTFTEAPLAGTDNIEIQISIMEMLTPVVEGAVTPTSVTTLTNKSIALSGNTLSGTLAEFNTALTDGDFATLAGAETLINKALTNPVVTDYSETLVVPVAGSSYAVSTVLGTVTKLATIANTAINLVPVTAGVSKSYSVIVAYGGAHTLTWTGGGTLKWAGGVAPTPTSVNGKFDIFVFTSDGVNTYGRSGGSNF